MSKYQTKQFEKILAIWFKVNRLTNQSSLKLTK